MNERQIKQILFAAVLAALVPLSIAAQDISEWRSPSNAELKLEELTWRKENPTFYLIATADFDGDGKEDTARLLLNDRENKIGLLVTLTTQKGSLPLLLDTINTEEGIRSMGIGVAKPAIYKTACGKGYWPCEKDEPAILNLKHPAIDFFTYESANSYFVWDTKKKKFDRIWISD